MVHNTTTPNKTAAFLPDRFQKPEWVDVPMGETYRLSLSLLGKRIILIEASGYATLNDIKKATRMIRDVARETIPEGSAYVHISDYSRLRGASFEARRYYIQHMKTNPLLLGLIFCGTSPMFNVSIKLAKKLNLVWYNVHIVRNHFEAIRLAIHLLEFHSDTETPQEFKKDLASPRGLSEGLACHILEREDWRIQLNGFSTRLEIIDGDILHSVAEGRLEEDHIPQLIALREKVKKEARGGSLFHYSIVGVAGLTMGSRKARKAYMHLVKSTHRDFPYRLYLLYGANSFLHASANLARPFMPFKIRIAKDMEHALSIIREHREESEKNVICTENGPATQDFSTPDRIQQYVDELLNFLGRINWDTNGLVSGGGLDASHPFQPVFEAITLIKSELDELFKERNNAYRALRESEEKYKQLYDEAKRAEELYRSLLHTSADAIAVQDLEGRVGYLNPSFTRIFGWTLEELEGKKIPFVPKEEKSATLPDTQRIAEEGKPIQDLETKRLTKDGRILDVNISGSRFNDHAGKAAGVLLTLRDTSERKRLEARLMHAQRMEAIGTLAGGIAHNFNNLLMGIQGYASLMAQEAKGDHPFHDKLAKIEKLVQSGSEMTGQLLGYAREGKFEVKPISLNRLAEETSETFRSTRKEIKVVLDRAPDLSGIQADRGQIEQVLLNLYVNAADAMPSGGELRLRTRNTDHRAMAGKSYNPKPGKYVLLTVTDTGLGMDAETMKRIFEPFFTTKGLAKGTGLGLASAYGIIKAHGGYIDVDSVEGHGTTFHVYLPASEKNIMEKEKMTEEQIQPGRETILLVDDEEIILQVGEELLKALGYRVLVADNGREALKIYESHTLKIDMVILDMIMPEMGGGETFDLLHAINPHLRVLLSSGYSLDGQAQEILDRGCDGFIQKPFNLRELSEKLRSILDGPGR